MTESQSSAPSLVLRETIVLALAGLWTLVIWSTRLRIASSDAATGWTDWARIVVSLVFGLMLVTLAINLRRGARNRWGAAAMIGFALWMVVVWVPSLVGVLAGDQSSAFKLIHSALAMGSLAVGALIGGLARRETLFYPRATSSQAAASSTAK